MQRAPLMRAGMPLLALAAAAMVGCGGGGSSSSGKSAGSTGGTGASGKQGGDVTYLSDGDVDYLDPGQTYYTFGFMVATATNRPLYAFKPGQPDTPVPDLADGEPQISSDNKTVTVKIREGVKFAPPVNRAVTTKDVKYAIERAFTSNVPSGYATSYFSEIEGAPSKPVKYSALKPFAGIQTPDDQTLVLKLTKPVAPRVAAALVMPITIPVPEEYAKPFDQKSPSTYDQQVAFTGPYMVKNDPKTGKVTGRDPGKRIQIVRNPNWDKATDFRPAYLDSMTIEEGNSDGTVVGRRTFTGTKTFSSDSSQPPPSILRQAVTRYKDQLGRVPGGGSRWIALNTTVKPLDNLNVRKAIIASFDRNALRQQRGGAAIGPIAQSFIPPGIPGNEESGGTKGFTDIDYMQNPGGDPALAKKYMLAAGKEGVPVDPSTGKYTGSQPLLMATDSGDPDNEVAQVAQGEFEKLGIKVRVRSAPRDTMYTKFCGVPSAKAAICPSVAWFRDFNDPESMLQPTFNGNAIKPAGNVNWSQLDDPKVNEAMDKAALTTGDQRNQAWADVNKLVVEQAPGIPYVWDDAFQLESPDMNGVMNEYTTFWDISFSSVK